jgi:hypothetical protein
VGYFQEALWKNAPPAAFFKTAFTFADNLGEPPARILKRQSKTPGMFEEICRPLIARIQALSE